MLGRTFQTPGQCPYTGDEMKVDFNGTSPQAKGNINCPWSCTQGGVFYTMVGIVDPYMVVNSGTFRPIQCGERGGTDYEPAASGRGNRPKPDDDKNSGGHAQGHESGSSQPGCFRKSRSGLYVQFHTGFIRRRANASAISKFREAGPEPDLTRMVRMARTFTWVGS